MVQPAPQRQAEGYMRQLDALRALAVAGVILEHYFPRDSAVHLLPTGFAGVRLFFVLSGFLITGILLRSRLLVETGVCSRGLAVRRFYIRRFLRIFPLYYAVLAGMYVFDIYRTRPEIGWHLTYLSNLLYGGQNYKPPATAHFWSLAVEEQFYLLWPTVILFVPRRRLLQAIGAMILIAPLSRAVGLAMGLHDEYAMQTFPVMCVDALGLGALLAYASEPGFAGDGGLKRGLMKWGGRVCTPLLLAGLALDGALHYRVLGRPLGWETLARAHGWVLAWQVIWDFSLPPLFAMTSVWIIGRAADGFRGLAGWLLSLGPLAYVGKIAYGVYIFHNVVFFAVPLVMARTPYKFTYVMERLLFRPLHIAPSTDRGHWFFVLFWTALSIAVAALSWHLYEKPINDLKRYFPYKPAGARARVTVASV